MKTIRDMVVVSKVFLNEQHFLLQCTHQETLPEILPGQFAEVRVDHNKQVFLRRPLSIHDVDQRTNSLTFLVKIIGCGTSELSFLKQGDLLNVIFPLGKGFGIETPHDALLVGGGCGSAPLLYLARSLQASGKKTRILLGARTAEELMEADEFAKYGEVFLSTDDGSLGEKGFVTQHSLWQSIAQFTKIFCCGPEAMMKAVAAMAKKKAIECEVSLENTMACGIGACLCCVTETIRGHECVCTSGPVFNINELKWQI